MALTKQSKYEPKQKKTMTFGDNQDLNKVLAKTKKDIKRVNFNISEDKHQLLKTLCAKNGMSISTLMDSLIDSWIIENKE